MGCTNAPDADGQFGLCSSHACYSLARISGYVRDKGGIGINSFMMCGYFCGRLHTM